MRLAVHHPQQHGSASRLGDGAAGCGKVIVGRGHRAILRQGQFTRDWTVSVQQCVHEWLTHPHGGRRHPRCARGDQRYPLELTGMEVSRSSVTAEQMALSRAIETCKPGAQQICCDPFAKRFLSLKYRALLLSRPMRDATERLIESQFAGHHYYVIARTRYFDDALVATLADPIEQLVILGAGYDSRAFRFADRLSRTAVFEVDHPATSHAKRMAMSRVVPDGLAPRITYVPVDFNVENLADRLTESGYVRGARSVFLWEGVSPYLDAAAVDGTLEFVRSCSAPGSVVMFDYILRSVVEGSCTLRGAQNEADKMRKTDEPLIFGIPDGQVPAFLSARGFRGVIDIGAEELKQSYFTATGSERRYVKPWWRIARAVVA
jgi:methyltransferase (TIGR00027 family)